MAHFKIPTGGKMKREKTYYLRLAVLLLVLTVIHGCDATDPNNTEKLYIEVADASCTESWLKVETTGINLPAELKLYRDNELAKEITINEKSTVIYDSLLSPSQSYTYQAKLPGISSREITATTLDTTSHDFTWQTYTFGEHASSVLYDVAIIDENNIWAVGQIYMYDSTGTVDPHAYNAVHWNGESWEVQRISFLYRDNLIAPQLYGIFALSLDDIWVSSGVPVHGDGVSWRQYHLFDMGILNQNDGYLTRIWGTRKDIYIIGTNGSITQYDEENWIRIESETELPIQDIWGVYNEDTNYNEIMCVASDKYYGDGPKLFRISNNSIVPLPINGLPWSLSSIWFKSKYKAYIVGDGIFVKNYPNEQWENITGDIASFYSHSVRGNNFNDVVVSGSGGEVIHFNGSTWQNYKDKGLPSFYGNYYLITIKGNVICAVGQAALDKNKAIISLGFR